MNHKGPVMTRREQAFWIATTLITAFISTRTAIRRGL